MPWKRWVQLTPIADYADKLFCLTMAIRESACSSDTLPSVSELNAGRQKLQSAPSCSLPCSPICCSSSSSPSGFEHFSIRPGITRVNALNLYDVAWSHSGSDTPKRDERIRASSVRDGYAMVVIPRESGGHGCVPARALQKID